MTKAKQTHDRAAIFAALDWRRIAGDMHEKGYAVGPTVLPHRMIFAMDSSRITIGRTFIEKRW